MTKTEPRLLHQVVAGAVSTIQPHEAVGRSEGSPTTEEQGMPGVIIHETPISLADVKFGPDTCMWVTDIGDLVLASGTDHQEVVAAGKTACEKHGYKLHEASLEWDATTHREKVDGPEELED